MDAESDITNKVLNIGSGNTHIVNRLAEFLGGDVVYIPKRLREPDCAYADISKVRKMLGWEPKVYFEEGIKIVLDHSDWWKEAPVWTPETIQEATEE